MHIDLPERWEQFVRDEVRRGRYPSEAAVLQEALALLRNSHRRRDSDDPVQSSAPRPIGAIIDDVMSRLPVATLERLPRRDQPLS